MKNLSIPTTLLPRARCVNHFLERALLIDLANISFYKNPCTELLTEDIVSVLK